MHALQAAGTRGQLHVCFWAGGDGGAWCVCSRWPALATCQLATAGPPVASNVGSAGNARACGLVMGGGMPCASQAVRVSECVGMYARTPIPNASAEGWHAHAGADIAYITVAMTFSAVSQPAAPAHSAHQCAHVCYARSAHASCHMRHVACGMPRQRALSRQLCTATTTFAPRLEACSQACLARKQPNGSMGRQTILPYPNHLPGLPSCVPACR